VVILDAESMSQIDSTALDGLGPILDDLDDHEAAFAIARLKKHLDDRLDRADLEKRIGDDRVFQEVDDAVQAYEAGLLTDSTPEEPAS
jgi:MFS superfamily sulfate permease-like transporter